MTTTPFRIGLHNCSSLSPPADENASSVQATLQRLVEGQERILQILERNHHMSPQSLATSRGEQHSMPSKQLDTRRKVNFSVIGESHSQGPAANHPASVPQAPLPPHAKIRNIFQTVLYTDTPWRTAMHGFLTVLVFLEFIAVSTFSVYCPESETIKATLVPLLLGFTTALLFVELFLNFNTALHRHTWDILDKLAEMFVNQDPFHGLARQRQLQLASIITRNNVPWVVQKSLLEIYPSLMESSMQDYYDALKDMPPFLSQKIMKYVKLNVVSSVPMFHDTPEACRVALADCLKEEIVPPGCNIVTQDEDATAMYFIIDGMVEVVVVKPDDEELQLTTLKEGSYFGEIALLQNTKHTASVRALCTVKVFRLDKANYEDIAARFPVLQDSLQAVANLRLKKLSQKNIRPKARELFKKAYFTSLFRKKVSGAVESSSPNDRNPDVEAALPASTESEQQKLPASSQSSALLASAESHGTNATSLPQLKDETRGASAAPVDGTSSPAFDRMASPAPFLPEIAAPLSFSGVLHDLQLPGYPSSIPVSSLSNTRDKVRGGVTFSLENS